jgi:hypothetical protein
MPPHTRVTAVFAGRYDIFLVDVAKILLCGMALEFSK